MGRIKGNLLMETICSLYILGLCVLCISLMFKQIVNIQFEYHQDLSYCLFSITQEITTASSVQVNDDSIELHNNDEISTFSLHNHRIVKKPGFVIYLHYVDELRFSHDENFVYLTLKRGVHNETFKVGVYKRPTIRICESFESDSVYDDIEYD